MCNCNQSGSYTNMLRWRQANPLEKDEPAEQHKERAKKQDIPAALDAK
jgi:hypothetical protein